MKQSEVILQEIGFLPKGAKEEKSLEEWQSAMSALLREWDEDW